MNNDEIEMEEKLLTDIPLDIFSHKRIANVSTTPPKSKSGLVSNDADVSSTDVYATILIHQSHLIPYYIIYGLIITGE